MAVIQVREPNEGAYGGMAGRGNWEKTSAPLGGFLGHVERQWRWHVRASRPNHPHHLLEDMLGVSPHCPE